MILRKVSFGTTKIQKLRRVALDRNLLETLGLEVGDTVSVELDTQNGIVLISRAAGATQQHRETEEEFPGEAPCGG
jgi:bifunctional DNA-binding transcriptional regulator/antitoxin component of YhaV-PrlF toxin-antitoxin module